MDLCDPKIVKQLCTKFGFRLKKGLGQNFLVNASVLGKIIDAADIAGADCIEVGPGFGALTAQLAACAARVVAIEKDSSLLPVLKHTLLEYNNVTVINDDVLSVKDISDDYFDGRNAVVVANLPYYITTPVFCHVIENWHSVSRIIIMVQEEVAERLVSPPGKKAYGAISVFTNYYGEPKMLFKVKADNFLPVPKVNSAVISVELKKKNITDDEKLFFRVVKAAFANRRKTLNNALKASGCFDVGNIISAIRNCGFHDMVRGEELSVYDFAKLADELVQV